MKSLITIVLGLVAISAVAQAGSAGCQSIKISSDGFFGNGFAISSNEVVTVDHVIAPNAETVELSQNGEKATATVLARSYRNDLALLRIKTAMQLQPCSLATGRTKSLKNVVISGTHMKDQTVSSISGSIVNTETRKLMVPGIEGGLEIAGAGLTRSFSGAPIVAGDTVIGITSEKTAEGNVLAIDSREISDFIRCARANSCPQKPYVYDYDSRSILFSGLKVADPLWINNDVVAGGNPHGGDPMVAGGNPHGKTIVAGGNPHGLQEPEKGDLYADGNPHGKPAVSYPVAGRVDDSAAVAATIQNQEVLMSQQPSIARVLMRDRTGSTVFIRSIDGIPTPNFMSLMAVLERCTECRIDSFTFETNDPAAIRTDMMRARAIALTLQKKIQPTNVDLSVELENYASLLFALQSRLAATHVYDPQLVESLYGQWTAIEKDISVHPPRHDDGSDDMGQVDDLYELRKFNSILKIKLRAAGWSF